LKPFQEANPGKTFDIRQAYTYENALNLRYYGYCMNEALRIDTPVAVSSTANFTKDLQIGKIFVKKGDPFSINMDGLHHNPKEWIDHEKYIPERFDSTSKYFLTPEGKKRHSMSFSPFLGGHRVCMGKTFSEMISKIIAPTLIAHYNFTLVDQNLETNIPPINLALKKKAVVMMNITKRDL
jgi:cytochrome P450